MLIASCLLLGPSYSHSSEVEFLFTPVPSLIGGTLKPFLVAVDGRTIAQTKVAVEKIQINGALVKTSASPERNFFFETKSDVIELEVFQTETKSQRKEVVLPRCTLKKMDKTTKTNFAEFQFEIVGAAKVEVDGRSLDINDGKVTWSTGTDNLKKVDVHSVVLTSDDGSLRQYDLFLIPRLELTTEEVKQMGGSDEWPAQLIRPPENRTIPGLSFATEFLAVKGARKDGKRQGVVRIQGQTQDPQATIEIGKTTLKVGPDGKFNVNLLVNNRVTDFQITSKNKSGIASAESVKVFFPAWMAFQKYSPIPLGRKLSVVPFLGYSQLTYQETGSEDFIQSGLAGRIFIGYQISPRKWDLDVTFQYQFLPLSKSVESVSAQYLDALVRFGYYFDFAKDPWLLGLKLGAGYSQITVSNRSFGMSTLTYPHPIFYLGRYFGQNDLIGVSGSFVPQIRDFSKFKFEDRKVSVGVSWTHTFGNGQVLDSIVEAVDSQLQADDLNRVATRYYSLSLGYGW